MVGYRYDRWTVCSRIGQELYIRYNRLRWERFRVRNRLYRVRCVCCRGRGRGWVGLGWVGYGTVRYGRIR